jgi:hypothetical protein
VKLKVITKHETELFLFVSTQNKFHAVSCFQVLDSNTAILSKQGKSCGKLSIGTHMTFQCLFSADKVFGTGLFAAKASI